MARVRIEYKRYRISSLATCVSFLGGIFSMAVLYPGIAFFAVSLIHLFINGIANAENWKTLGASLILCLVCFGASVVLRLIFDSLADAIAKAKGKHIRKKQSKH